MPVDTDDVGPGVGLLAHLLYHSIYIGAQVTLDVCTLLGGVHLQGHAPITVEVSLGQVFGKWSTIARLVDCTEAHFTHHDLIALFIIFFKAHVTNYVIILFVLAHSDERVRIIGVDGLSYVLLLGFRLLGDGITYSFDYSVL